MDSGKEKLVREIISRGTLLLLGFLLLAGAVRCAMVVPSTIQDSSLPLLIALFLAVVGTFSVLAAVTPIWLLEKIVRPPQVGLFDGAEERQSSLLGHLLWLLRR